MKQCSQCGHAAPDASKFCPKCGATLPEPAASGQLCPDCQNPVGPEEKFCGNCGFNLQQPQPEVEKEKETPPEEGNLPHETATEPADEVRQESPSDADDSAKAEGSQQAEEAASAADTPPPDEIQDDSQEASQPLAAEGASMAQAQDAASSDEKEPEASQDPDDPLQGAAQSPDEPVSQQEEVAETPAPTPDPTPTPTPTPQDGGSSKPPVAATSMPDESTSAKPATVFCPRCGTKHDDQATFCRGCGHNLKRRPQGPPTTATAAPPPPQAPMPPPGYGPPSAPPSPKKKSKAPLIIVLVLAIIALIALIVVFAVPALSRLFAGPTAAYVSLERADLQQKSSDLSEQAADLGNRSDAAAGGHVVDFGVSVDPGLGLDPVMQSTMENLTLRSRVLYDRSVEPTRYFAGIDVLTHSEPLMTMEGFYDSEQLIVGMPNVLSRYLMIPSSYLDEMSGDVALDVGLDAGMFNAFLGLDLAIDEDALTQSMHDMIEIYLDYVDDVELETNQPLEAGGVQNTYDRYFVRIEGDDAYDLLLDLLTHVREDDDLFNLFASIANLDEDAVAMGYGLTREDWHQQFDWMIEDIEWNREDDLPLIFEQEVYSDGDEIVGRNLRLFVEDDMTPSLQFIDSRPVSDDGQKVAAISLTLDGNTMHFVNTYREDQGQKTGTIEIRDDWETLLVLDYGGYEKVTLGSRDYPVGEFYVSVPGAGADGLPSSIQLTTSVFNDQFMIDLSVPGFGQLRIGYHEVFEQDVQMPSYTQDQMVSINEPDFFEQMVTEETWTEMMRIMEQLNFDFMDLME